MFRTWLGYWVLGRRSYAVSALSYQADSLTPVLLTGDTVYYVTTTKTLPERS